jgi:signal peptidase I
MLEFIEKTLLVCIIFVAGMLVATVYNEVFAATTEVPTATSAFASNTPTPQNSPSDWMKEQDISVYNNRVILNIQNPQWAKFTDTHSMEPVLSSNANAIEIVPQSEDQLKVGDIVSYKSDYADGYVIHRIVSIGKDDQGTYFVLKGDNNPTSDPGKVRFKQIQRVVIAIVY